MVWHWILNAPRRFPNVALECARGLIEKVILDGVSWSSSDYAREKARRRRVWGLRLGGIGGGKRKRKQKKEKTSMNVEKTTV